MMTILRYFIKGREREKTCTAMMTATTTTATAEKETSRIELRKSVDLRGGGSTDRSHSAAFKAFQVTLLFVVNYYYYYC